MVNLNRECTLIKQIHSLVCCCAQCCKMLCIPKVEMDFKKRLDKLKKDPSKGITFSIGIFMSGSKSPWQFIHWKLGDILEEVLFLTAAFIISLSICSWPLLGKGCKATQCWSDYKALWCLLSPCSHLRSNGRNALSSSPLTLGWECSSVFQRVFSHLPEVDEFHRLSKQENWLAFSDESFAYDWLSPFSEGDCPAFLLSVSVSSELSSSLPVTNRTCWFGNAASKMFVAHFSVSLWIYNHLCFKRVHHAIFHHGNLQ